MAQFEVIVTETLEYVYTVKADSPEEATALVEKGLVVKEYENQVDWEISSVEEADEDDEE